MKYMVTNFIFCCLHLSLKIASLDLKIEQIKLFSIKKDNKIGKEKKKASANVKRSDIHVLWMVVVKKQYPYCSVLVTDLKLKTCFLHVYLS